MDSHDSRIGAEMLHGDRHGILTAVSTLDDRDRLGKTSATDKLADFLNRLPRRRNNDAVHQPRCIEFPDRVNQNRRVVQNEKLLRTVYFHPPPGACSRNDGGDFHMVDCRGGVSLKKATDFTDYTDECAVKSV